MVGSDDMTALAQLLKTNPDIQIKSFEKWILISLPQNMGIGDINKYCFENQVVLTHLQYRKRSLESKFIEITQ